MAANAPSVGVAQLGWLGFEVSDLAAWESFTTRVLGLEMASSGEDGRFSLRMDGHAHRFFVAPGDADALAFVGWEVADDATLNALEARLRGAGVDVVDAGEAVEQSRRARRVLQFRDPGGVPTELFVDPDLAEAPFASRRVPSGFVADELGLGHVVLGARDRAESEAFYRDVLGFRLSDHIQCDLGGYAVDLAFLHANARHHSVAVGGPQPKGLHHFMLEVGSVDDVGRIMNRTMRAGLPIQNTLGRHPNDKMLSFYAQTPSGFQFEVGCQGRLVDDATWEPTVHDRISEWGHHPPRILR